MGFFQAISKSGRGTSIGMIITQAKEGKLTVMFYPTTQKDDDVFIPISITDLPDVLDDNIEDYLDKYLTAAVERFSTSNVAETSKPSDHKSSKKEDSKAGAKSEKDKKPEVKTQPGNNDEQTSKPPEKAAPPPPPDLFNNDTVIDPEEYVEGPDEAESSNEVDEF